MRQESIYKVNPKIVVSVILKISIVLFVILGFTYSYFNSHEFGYQSLMYFTLQSNILIAAFDFLMIFILIHNLIKHKDGIPNMLYKVSQVLTVCISITGIIFCGVLAPGYYMDKSNAPPDFVPFSISSIFLHVVVPVLSVIDYFIFTRNAKFTYKDSAYVLVPNIAYLIFASIGYVANWDFGNNINYPYFFLNYDSPAGIFGFSSTSPYYIGSFYWIIILFTLAMCLSLLYIKIIMMVDKHIASKLNKQSKGENIK